MPRIHTDVYWRFARQHRNSVAGGCDFSHRSLSTFHEERVNLSAPYHVKTRKPLNVLISGDELHEVTGVQPATVLPVGHGSRGGRRKPDVDLVVATAVIHCYLICGETVWMQLTNNAHACVDRLRAHSRLDFLARRNEV